MYVCMYCSAHTCVCLTLYTYIPPYNANPGMKQLFCVYQDISQDLWVVDCNYHIKHLACMYFIGIDQLICAHCVFVCIPIAM